VALKVSIADSSVPLIDESTAFTVGPFGYISDVLFAVHDVRPSSVLVLLVHPLYIIFPHLLYSKGNKKKSCFEPISAKSAK
jgi:hypothetical protein